MHLREYKKDASACHSVGHVI
ncbi:MAG: hypothetical protein RLZZ379_951, partial [Pseudomonadota bacterium]